jgi:hypothetical protein
MTLQGSDLSFLRGQDLNFVPRAFSASSQRNAAHRPNDTSSLQAQSGRQSMNQAEPEPQMLQVTSPMEQQRTVNTPPAGKGESSRRRWESLAEENVLLRNELENLRSQNQDVNDAMEKMLSDLIEAQLGLQEKEALVDRQKGVMKKQKTQLEQLQDNVSNLSAELKESRTRETMNVPPNPELEQAVGMMRTEIREKELQLKEKDQILREREIDWKVELHELKGKLTQQQMQHEKAVDELHELQATAISRDNGQLAAATSQAEAENARAEQYLHELQQLKTKHAQTLSQIESEKTKTQQAVQELHQLKTMQAEALSQVEAEKAKTQQYAQELQQLKATSAETATVKDNSQLLDQLKAAHATELAEIRRISDFFKNNSERLSRQMKDMMAENHILKESIKTKDCEAQEQASHIKAIELQIRGF